MERLVLWFTPWGIRNMTGNGGPKSLDSLGARLDLRSDSEDKILSTNDRG